MRRVERDAILRAPLSWTLASVVAAVALHASHLPFWALATFVLLVLWRVLIGLRSSRLPSRVLRIVVVIAVVGAVLLGYRTLNGVDAGTTLLALMAAMKLLETRNARDQLVLLLIAYFLVLAAFLYSQQLWLLPVAAAVTWLITAALLRVAHAAAPLSPAIIVARSGAMLLQAVPIMVLLFLLFPRVPGPFWALPTAEHATSGLGEEMAPGDITELSLSSDVAFRIRFRGAAPPPAQRYWRGPVLHDFDGYTWRRTRSYLRAAMVETRGPQYDYRLMLEPTDNYWVFALDMPVHWGDSRLHQTYDYQLIAQDRITQPETYELTSRPLYRAAAADRMGKALFTRDTAFPRSRNVRAQELARRMYATAGSADVYIRAVLNMFREQRFFYTLSPSRLDLDSVDDFLFNTRRGFCAHYASAFTMLMRAAGIPARVVTGYQGGEYNRLAGYYIVRQSDAHAWSEVWLPGRGWVREDPTAAVAPERIERGTASALAADEPFAERMIRDNAWLADIRFAWDAVNTLWRENVIQFSARKQEQLLGWLGINEPDWRDFAALIAGGIAVALTLLSFLLARELRFHSEDPVQRAYQRFCRRLERRGLKRLAHEGPLDFLARIERARPDLAGECERIARLYIDLRYASVARQAALRELLRRVRAFHPVARPG